MEKEQFCGKWGRLREEFLQQTQPDTYEYLRQSGELTRYLDGYQAKYSAKAEQLATTLAKERGVDDEFFKRDALAWLTATEQIEREVAEQLRGEIWR